MTDKWATPQQVTGAEFVFGGNMEKLLPPRQDIPKTFDQKDKWEKVQRDWFYRGITKPKWEPKPGINPRDAVRHLGAIQGSFEPSHEHKEEAVAWLLSRWFDDVEYEVGDANR